MSNKKKSSIHCSFCQISSDNSNLFIEGDNCHICSDCIEKSYSLISTSENNSSDIIVKKPHQIKKELDKIVIGQDLAKKTTSLRYLDTLSIPIPARASGSYPHNSKSLDNI